MSCTANAALGALSAFNDTDAARSLRIGLLAVSDFNGPALLATCDFLALPAPVAGDFGISIVESFAADLSAVASTIGVTGITCN